jgi:hypothetical protein
VEKYGRNRNPKGIISLDLSSNNIQDKDASKIASIISIAPNLERIILKNNKIQANGLQQIASALAQDESKVIELDISENPIPDFNLKILLAMLYNNQSIEKIEYSVSEKENLERKVAF